MAVPKRGLSPFGIVVVVSLVTGLAYADELAEELSGAIEDYQAGNYSAAIEKLNFGIMLLNQKLQEQIAEKGFPEPLEGWSAGEAEGTGAAQAFLGGGIVSSREYRKGEGRVTIEIMSHSPLLSGIMMMMNNPLFASSSPSTQILKIKGERAIQETSEGGGKISLVLEGKVLIKIEGDHLESIDPVTAYAEAINLEVLRGIFSG